MGKALKVGSELKGTPRAVTQDKMVAFERVIWHRVLNAHSDHDIANKHGISRTVASGQNQLAFLHELMEVNFAEGWISGGKISARWIHPVYAGDFITARARVQAITEEAGRKWVELEVWCENRNGEKTAAGTAGAYLK